MNPTMNIWMDKYQRDQGICTIVDLTTGVVRSSSHLYKMMYGTDIIHTNPDLILTDIDQCLNFMYDLYNDKLKKKGGSIELYIPDNGGEKVYTLTPETYPHIEQSDLVNPNIWRTFDISNKGMWWPPKHHPREVGDLLRDWPPSILRMETGLGEEFPGLYSPRNVETLLNLKT